MAPTCKVLIVEDDVFVRQLLGEVFDGEGFDFILADGAVAMREALAREPTIDVIVIDVGLPGPADGLTLAREAATRGYAVIVVTGDHLREDALRASGHRYLTKPFRLSALMEQIEELLAETRNECRRASQATR